MSNRDTRVDRWHVDVDEGVGRDDGMLHLREHPDATAFGPHGPCGICRYVAERSLLRQWPGVRERAGHAVPSDGERVPERQRAGAPVRLACPGHPFRCPAAAVTTCANVFVGPEVGTLTLSVHFSSARFTAVHMVRRRRQCRSLASSAVTPLQVRRHKVTTGTAFPWVLPAADEISPALTYELDTPSLPARTPRSCCY